MIARRLEEKNQALAHLAMHDILTGLPNRALLYERLGHYIKSANPHRDHFALLVMDLDRFKDVNDTLGHQLGDELLRVVCRRMQSSLRDSDILARIGGDEFAMLIPNGDSGVASLCAKRLVDSMEGSFSIGGIELGTGVSIGIALFPEHGADADELIQHADVAMYQAKKLGSRHSMYNPDEDSNTIRRLRLLGDLRHAIEQGEFSLHYQPKVEIGTGRVIGVEALARWQHHDLGFVPPDEFIPMVEQSGVIRRLTAWVLESALDFHRDLHNHGYDIQVAVNISACDIHDTSLRKATISAGLARGAAHHVIAGDRSGCKTRSGRAAPQSQIKRHRRIVRKFKDREHMIKVGLINSRSMRYCTQST